MFADADFQLASGLNVVIGENGAGKTHFLKAAYTVAAVSAWGKRESGTSTPTKNYLEVAIAKKLRGVIRPDALGRADVLVVTRKSASLQDADGIANRLRARFPSAELAVCHLALDALVDARTGDRRPLSWLADRRVLATAAVGEPAAFFAQLSALGARMIVRPYRDHHAFTTGEVAELAAAAGRREGLVCTLKDAVKLASLWPAAAAPLWYVSQIAVIERGGPALDRALEAVLAARQPATSTAGPAGLSSLPNGHRSSTAD